MENKTKLRLLYLYQHLLQYTDAEHKLSTPQLIEILDKQYGIEVSRNTLANDFKMLEQAGVKFEVVRSQQNQYYYDGRVFDLAELKIMIDAISSSKFITEKKSRDLIEKVLSLTIEHNAASLRRHVHVEGRVKSENERGYYIVDTINEAIDGGYKIKFQYADYSTKKRKVVRHDGEYYVVSPYSLVWDGDYYYVIGFSEMRGKVQNFRLDRIFRLPEALPNEPIIPAPHGFNLAEYSREVFRIRHPQMDVGKRAKIFAPFDALRGFNFAILMKNELYEEQLVLSPEDQEELDRRFGILHNLTYNSRMARANRVQVTVIYYEPCSDVNSESYGSQGQYKTVTGICWNVDAEVTRTILVDEMRIRMEDIRSIESQGDIFKRNWEDQSAGWDT